MMPYAAHTPRQSAASALGTTHAESLPIAFSHALPSVSASFASHTRAVSEKVYAEITPRPITSAEAGHSAAGTSPIRATPEGSERTPAPSAALQMLNVVVVKLAPSSVEAGGGDAAASPSSGNGTAAAAHRICGRSDNGRTAALRSCKRAGRPGRRRRRRRKADHDVMCVRGCNLDLRTFAQRAVTRPTTAVKSMARRSKSPWRRAVTPVSERSHTPLPLLDRLERRLAALGLFGSSAPPLLLIGALHDRTRACEQFISMLRACPPGRHLELLRKNPQGVGIVVALALASRSRRGVRGSRPPLRR